jgi:hypothetical protein
MSGKARRRGEKGERTGSPLTVPSMVGGGLCMEFRAHCPAPLCATQQCHVHLWCIVKGEYMGDSVATTPFH